MPLPTIERIVEEGVLISASAVRMATKNRLMIAALREHLDYDPAVLGSFARQHFLLLAQENEQTSERLDQAVATTREPLDLSPVPDPQDELRHEDHLRRPGIHRILAEALREIAGDPVAIAALVDQARVDANDELRREVSKRVHRPDFDTEPDYELERPERIRQLVTIDLASLRGDDVS